MAGPKKAKAQGAKKARGLRRLILGLAKWGFIVFVAIPVLWVALYRFVPPPATFLMLQRAAEGRGLDYRWRSIDRISPALVRAAIASEDARFCSHKGFDWDAIDKAMKNNARGRRMRGGSTISQQTAKNVFLWPHRDWIRKGFEAYFTSLIELIWGKKRIMEVYLNVAEMGPGVYGAQAAARTYFKTNAANLTQAQAARLVAVLPNPIKYKAAAPGRYVRRRTGAIGARARVVGRSDLDACVLG